MIIADAHNRARKQPRFSIARHLAMSSTSAPLSGVSRTSQSPNQHSEAEAGTPALNSASRRLHTAWPRERLVAQDKSALIDALYREFSPMMISVAKRMLRETCDAEDVVHQLFVRLPKLLEQYKGVNMGGWLKRATVTQCLMHFRSIRRRRECLLEPSSQLAPHPQSQHVLHSEINWALMRLSPSLREVIVLRYFMSYSHQESAEILGISSAASEIRACRAIKQLRLLVRSGEQMNATGTECDAKKYEEFSKRRAS